MPIKHRMELLNIDKNLSIIDDSFSGNINGTEQSLNLLKKFDCLKIVITPGIVELGEKQDEAKEQ